MTIKHYYHDSYTTAFTARVVEQIEVDQHPAVILDQTYFYPSGGGQPHDTGMIGGARVIDVISSSDGDVVHVLDGQPPSEEAACEVDYQRRFDLMQHHTGQHILTRAFEQCGGISTVSFHLTPANATIDVDHPEITPAIMQAVEDLANQIIYENRPVKVHMVDADNPPEHIRIRKMPDVLTTEGLRVIEVDDFDATACGGTHVSHTGEIGIIKIMGKSRQGDQFRIEFMCGGRALRELRARNDALSEVAAHLSVGYWEVEEAVHRLQDDLKTSQRARRAITQQIITYQADTLLNQAEKRDDIRLIKKVLDDIDTGELRKLASLLVEKEPIVVLLGVAGEKAQLIMARHPSVEGDMAAALKEALAVLGTDRGGGRPDFAQGGGVVAPTDAVQSALDAAETYLLSQL